MSGVTRPLGWSSKRLKYLATYNDEVLAENTDKDQEIDYVEISGVSLSRGIEQVERMTFGQVPSRARRKVRSGDVLISTVRTYLRAIATVNEASSDLIASTGFCVVRPNDEVDSGFIGWAARSEPFVSEVVARSVGVSYPAINASELVTIEIPLPPLETQRRIARFLDEKTARIDGLIEKKRALLDRLAEKRQALITRAVTKGLNPDAPMKPSGIDWLGDIPSHWNLLRLKFIVSEPLSYGVNAAAEFDEPEWPRFVRITDVDELGRLRDETFRSLPPDVADGYLLQPNDILLARSGATVGKSFIYKISWGVACYAGYLIRARIKKEHDARFFYWFLNSILYWDWVGSNFIQSTIQNISADRYANLQIPHPPNKDEQQQIVDVIESSCAQIDSQWEAITRSVGRLNEFRAALITAAVTGQIAELR
ncbi:MAG: restriction endonuclease subunit S [Chromatiaceae bacterium]